MLCFIHCLRGCVFRIPCSLPVYMRWAVDMSVSGMRLCIDLARLGRKTNCRWKESWSGCLTTDSECYYCFRRWKQKLHLACLFQWFHFFVSELHFNDKLIWFLVFLVWSFNVSSSTQSPTHRMASSRQFKVFCVLCGACFTAGGAAEFTRFSLHIKDTVKVTLTVTVVICIMFTCWLCLFVCMCWGVGVSMELLTSF